MGYYQQCSHYHCDQELEKPKLSQELSLYGWVCPGCGGAVATNNSQQDMLVELALRLEDAEERIEYMENNNG
jgi:transcription initiation factor IIE alpha subunit